MQNINLDELKKVQFDIAKSWLNGALISSFLVLGINVLVIFMKNISPLLAVLAAVFTILNAVFIWRSEAIKDKAEATLRKLDMYNGLGWGITAREISNLKAMASLKEKQAAQSDKAQDYFASKEPPGPLRLVENMEQSAWYTWHQSRRMAMYVRILSAIIFAASMITLYFLVQNSANQTVTTSIADTVIVVVTFLFSVGLIRLAFDYNTLFLEAEKIERQANQLRQGSDISEIDAIKLAHEYQIIRVRAPILPNWLWRIMGPELDDLWERRISTS